MGFDRDFPAGGGLISYGANVPDVRNQAGVYVGRILKGQKPAEMPGEAMIKAHTIGPAKSIN